MVKIPKFIGALFFLALLLLFGYIIPITLVFGNAEISNPDIASQINLYQGLLLVGLVGIFLLYYGKQIWKGDDEYGNSFGFFNIGESPSSSFFKNYSSFQLGLLSLIIIFSIFFILNFASFNGFTGFKVLPQQFSKTESLVFSTLLIPIGEEAISLFLVGILVLSLIVIANKTNMSKPTFLIYLYLVIPILMGIAGRIWHISAYPGSDINAFVIFMFWTVKTFLTIYTGYALIPIFLHQANNFFIDFGRLFSSSTVFVTIIILLIASITLYISVYGFTLKGKSGDG